MPTDNYVYVMGPKKYFILAILYLLHTRFVNEFNFFCRMAPEMPPPPPPPTSRSSASASREAAVVASATDHQLQSKAYLSPSDASIDESVKSAQAGKDVSDLFCLSPFSIFEMCGWEPFSVLYLCMPTLGS